MIHLKYMPDLFDIIANKIAFFHLIKKLEHWTYVSCKIGMLRRARLSVLKNTEHGPGNLEINPCLPAVWSELTPFLKSLSFLIYKTATCFLPWRVIGGKSWIKRCASPFRILQRMNVTHYRWPTFGQSVINIFRAPSRVRHCIRCCGLVVNDTGRPSALRELISQRGKTDSIRWYQPNAREISGALC